MSKIFETDYPFDETGDDFLTREIFPTEIKKISIHRKEIDMSNGTTRKESQSIEKLVTNIVDIANSKGANIDINLFDKQIYKNLEKIRVLDAIAEQFIKQQVELVIRGRKKLGKTSKSADISYKNAPEITS